MMRKRTMRKRTILVAITILFLVVWCFQITPTFAVVSRSKADYFDNPPSVSNDIWTESPTSNWARNGKKYVSSWWNIFFPAPSHEFWWYIPSEQISFRESRNKIFPYYKYPANDRYGECIFIIQSTACNPEAVIAWKADNGKGKVWFGVLEGYVGGAWVYEVLWSSGWSTDYNELVGVDDRLQMNIYENGRVRCYFRGDLKYDDTPEVYEQGGAGYFNCFKFYAYSHDVWNPLRKAGLDYWWTSYYSVL